MYESFYCFREKPFQLAPNPDFLYKSEKHQNALTYLEYGLTENVGIIVLTGEVGSGKTTCAGFVLQKLDDCFDTAMLINTNITGDQMLQMICDEFELSSGGDGKAGLIDALNSYFIRQYEAGRRILLVIDEAQNLSAQALEEVRMLSNLQDGQDVLVQILLVGQPELLQTLKKKEMRQFTQRVAVHFHLTALDREDTLAYIDHRVVHAGGDKGLFTPAAMKMVYDLSGGIPRSINLVCQAALVYGFADEAERITQDIIRQITKDRIGVGIVLEPDGEGRSKGAVSAGKDRAREQAAVAAAPPPGADLENIRMEVKGRIQQMEEDSKIRSQKLVKKIARLLVQEQKRNLLLEKRIEKLEKTIAVVAF